jgi:hypothetical protein
LDQFVVVKLTLEAVPQTLAGFADVYWDEYFLTELARENINARLPGTIIKVELVDVLNKRRF